MHILQLGVDFQTRSRVSELAEKSDHDNKQRQQVSAPAHGIIRLIAKIAVAADCSIHTAMGGRREYKTIHSTYCKSTIVRAIFRWHSAGGTSGRKILIIAKAEKRVGVDDSGGLLR